LAWKRLSFPDPVFLNRFTAARFVFIFGMAMCLSRLAPAAAGAPWSAVTWAR
jgi:hypothetical protein